MGFEKITALSQELETMDLAAMFKKVGMTMYSAVGGSSGALYGSGYMAASRYCMGKDYLDVHSLYEMYEAMLQEIMKRGKTEPGQKTMLDACHRHCLPIRQRWMHRLMKRKLSQASWKALNKALKAQEIWKQLRAEQAIGQIRV